MARQILKSADGASYEVALEAMPGDARTFALHINAEPEEQIEIDEQNPGQGCLRLHGRITPFYALRNGQTLQVWLEGQIHKFEIVDRTARRAGGASQSGVRPEITAPMPGTVLKIAVNAGDRFEANQPLIIMESMKMEMTLSAPHAGTIKEILCRPGQLVEMGAVLVKLEPELA